MYKSNRYNYFETVYNIKLKDVSIQAISIITKTFKYIILKKKIKSKIDLFKIL